LLTPLDKSPNQQDEHRTHNGSDKTGALILAIPADRLSEVSRHECADDAQDGRQYKALRFVIPRRDQFGDHTCNKADDDDPDKVIPPDDGFAKTCTTGQTWAQKKRTMLVRVRYLNWVRGELHRIVLDSPSLVDLARPAHTLLSSERHET
jgi:hypothetical protein